MFKKFKQKNTILSLSVLASFILTIVFVIALIGNYANKPRINRIKPNESEYLMLQDKIAEWEKWNLIYLVLFIIAFLLFVGLTAYFFITTFMVKKLQLTTMSLLIN